MFCTKCGGQLSDSAAFCPKCGAKIERSDNTKPASNHTKIIVVTLAVLAVIVGASVTAAAAINVFGPLLTTANQDETAATDSGTTAATNPAISQIEILQVDNSQYPQMTVYCTANDATGNTISELGKGDFTVFETSETGEVADVTLADVKYVQNSSTVSVDLVLDASGSMDSENKIGQARSAAKSFVGRMDLSGGDQAEIVFFDSYVYLSQSFTSDPNSLTSAIDMISTEGETALYDAIYAGIQNTYRLSGSRCVIVFTDGRENASSHSYDEVVSAAESTGIPVYIIGVGADVDTSELTALATGCSGQYYAVDASNLDTVLGDVYWSIYQSKRDCYQLTYTSSFDKAKDVTRKVAVKVDNGSDSGAEASKEFVPEASLNTDFSVSYANKVYMIGDSSSQRISTSDLSSMSLAELRIARNEIFARHGRQFKDSELNKWFYSKQWYLSIIPKYAPDTFDAISPSPLTDLETDNVNTIVDYEQQLMETRDIYPNAASVELTSYDLCLSKAVLNTALSQMQGYSSTATLQTNIKLVQDAINQEEVQY